MIMKHHLMYSRGFNLHFIILCVQEKTAPIFFSAPFFGHVNLSLYLCFSQEKIKPYVRFCMSCVLFESQCMNLFFFSTAINEGYFRIKCLQVPCQLSLRYSRTVFGVYQFLSCGSQQQQNQQQQFQLLDIISSCGPLVGMK